LAGARRGEAADAARLQGPRPAWADGVEKSAGRERDVPERRALHRQSELQAVPAAVLKLAAPALCTQVAARFGERSCAAPVVAEQLALPQPEALAEHPLMQQVQLVKTLSQPKEPLAAVQGQ
jgi:hypothetical protein